MDLSVVLGPMVDKPVGSLYSSIKRHVGYVYNWRGNIQNLQQEARDLNIEIGNVQGKIEEAAAVGHIILDAASDWLREANCAKEDAEKFLNEKLNGDERCLKGLCPNICSRYLLSREVKKKTTAIVRLKESGSTFQRVSKPPPPPSFGSRFGSPCFEAFESRRSVFEEILNGMKDRDIHVIEIYGMGGVGKTTMAVEAGARAEKDHTVDEVVKVAVSRNPNVDKIQDELAELLNLKLEEKTKYGKAGRLLERLKNGKKILIILDDVWKELNLKEIGIPSADGMNHCKILVTTRNESVRLVDTQIDKMIPIGVLSDKEAWILFQRQVEYSIPPDMHGVAKQVCKECAGLPIAILAIGRTLNRKTLNRKTKLEWDDVLEQLRESQLNKIDGVGETVYASLLVSYNNLDLEDAKTCFLFCCLFPEDFDIPMESILRYGRGVEVPSELKTVGAKRNRVQYLVNYLKRNCLLLEGRDEEHVKMHDVIRDVAISIASEGQHVFLSETRGDIKEWPMPKRETYASYTAISLAFNSGSVLEFPIGMECPKLNTLLSLSFSTGWEMRPQLLKIPPTFFLGMINLKVLVLMEVKIPELPPSIESLVHLRVLGLKACALGELSSVGKVKTLETLILTSSKFDLLPTEIGDLSHLRLLDLRGCYNLKSISPGVLSHLSGLEELFLPIGCFGMRGRRGVNNQKRKVNLAELKSLSRLVALEMHVPPKFETLPQELGSSFWANLTSFKISINGQLHYPARETLKNTLSLKGVSLTLWVAALLRF